MSSVPNSTSSLNTAPSATPSPNHDPRSNIVAIVLAIVGLFIIGIIVFTTLRLKRRRSVNNAYDDSFASPSQGTILDRSHPAAQITPFGSPGGETPRFKHTPGADMRIAIRRPDGAWHFADPRAPFVPSGVSDIDVLPSPSSSTSSFPLARSRAAKEQESKASREARMGYDRDYDVRLNPPPPAYAYEYGGYLNHAKS